MNKKLLTVAIAGAMAAPMAAHAVKYKLSGQVNRAVVFMDDGNQSAIRNVDSTTSGTRFRLRGSEDLGDGMKVGFYWELQTQSGGSTRQRPDLNGEGDDPAFGGGDLRQANVWFSGNWGKLTIGQTDGAANGASEADLSGTAISGAYHGRTSFSAGMRWRTGAGGCITSGGAAGACGATSATGGSFFSEFDGFSRHDVIRYDSPALGPVTVAASVGQDSVWEVAGRVDTSLGGGQLSAALFYGEDGQAVRSAGTDSRYGGSISYLFSQGTNITFAYTANEYKAGAKAVNPLTGLAGNKDADVYTIKLGHKWGPNAVSIQYGEASDVNADGLDDSGFAVGYVRSIKKANTELYASYIHQELDNNSGQPGLEDFDLFVVGARVKFD